MRVSVASTGGGTGSASTGKAARRSVRYSSTGSTTQPAVEVAFWAKPVAATKRTASVRPKALLAIAAHIGPAPIIDIAERVRNAAGRIDPARRDVNIPSRFIVFLL